MSIERIVNGERLIAYNKSLQWTAGERVGFQIESLCPAATELPR